MTFFCVRIRSYGHMSSPSAPAIIFNEALARMRRSRAKGREHFLMSRILDDLSERLLDINRGFEAAAIFADTDIRYGLPAARIPEAALYPALDIINNPLPEKSQDIIISILGLHVVNDVPGAMIQMQRALKPDGVMMAVLFGGDTLNELRQVLYKADDLIHGGISPRVHPFADYSALAALLQRTGFALPVVDTDRINVRYSSIVKLFSDLRDMGETSALMESAVKPLTPAYLTSAMQIYAKDYSHDNGKLPATFELMWMTGWAPHESQQKPLRPGSAKTRLADVLGAKETKLDKD